MSSFSSWFWGEPEKSDSGVYRSTKPVSVEEGQKLFDQAYKSRSTHSKRMDLSKKQKKTLIPGSKDSYKYRNRYDPNDPNDPNDTKKVVARGAIEFDLDGVDAGLGPVLANGDKRKLRMKSERLYRAYESNYEEFLKATHFWEQLHKIKFDAVNSYHDIFTQRIVGCSTPMWNADKLAKYSDVINTAFYLAVKNKLVESLVQKKTSSASSASSVSGTSKKKEDVNYDDAIDAPKSLLQGYFRS